ncbi:hypothetical protein HAX54_043476 [Datura stramonium]|uniref:Uncharacterized protein n=1 Tax=Datura stramonium TaxID=4076 RepID=A0ABS8W358_DATST|nr:hypothetical protein [Datura stramonium]
MEKLSGGARDRGLLDGSSGKSLSGSRLATMAVRSGDLFRSILIVGRPLLDLLLATATAARRHARSERPARLRFLSLDLGRRDLGEICDLAMTAATGLGCSAAALSPIGCCCSSLWSATDYKYKLSIYKNRFGLLGFLTGLSRLGRLNQASTNPTVWSISTITDFSEILMLEFLYCVRKDIGNLSLLEELVIYNNNLTSLKTYGLETCKSLEQLMLGDNLLMGTFSANLSKLQNLSVLELFYNRFSGLLPP